MFPLVNNSRRRKFMNHENHNTRNTGTHKFNIFFARDSGNNKTPPDGRAKRWNRSFTVSKTNIFKTIWIVRVKTKCFTRTDVNHSIGVIILYYDNYYSDFSCLIVFPCFFVFQWKVLFLKQWKRSITTISLAFNSAQMLYIF